MSERKKPRKRILNPVTGKYYKLRERSSKYGETGQIKGLWSSGNNTKKSTRKSKPTKRK